MVKVYVTPHTASKKSKEEQLDKLFRPISRQWSNKHANVHLLMLVLSWPITFKSDARFTAGSTGPYLTMMRFTPNSFQLMPTFYFHLSITDDSQIAFLHH
jgi:hypothetical protein